MNWLVWIPCLLAQGSGGGEPSAKFHAYERSVAMVQGELARHPRNAELSLLLAQIHSRAYRFDEALEVYNEGSQAHPKDDRFVAGLGKTYLAQGEPKLACEHLRRALTATRPGSPTRAVRLPLADAYTRAGDFASAVEQLRAAAGEGSPSAQISFRLGQALDTESRRLRSQGEVEKSRSLAAEARRSLEEAIRLRPQYADAHYALGRLFARLGEKALAKKSLEEFRRHRRENKGVDEKDLSFTDASLEAGTAVDVARVLSSLGETNRALHFTARALKVLPGFEPAIVAQGSICLEARRPQEAKRVFEALLSVYPHHRAALMGLAEIHIAQKDYQKASEYLLRAGRSGRAVEAWEVLYRLASDGLVLKERAEEFARTALRMRPSVENYRNLAITLFDAGKHAECERVLRTGLARYPGHNDLVVVLQLLENARKEKR